jgi:hypothetical protein
VPIYVRLLAVQDWDRFEVVPTEFNASYEAGKYVLGLKVCRKPIVFIQIAHDGLVPANVALPSRSWIVPRCRLEVSVTERGVDTSLRFDDKWLSAIAEYLMNGAVNAAEQVFGTRVSKSQVFRSLLTFITYPAVFNVVPMLVQFLDARDSSSAPSTALSTLISLVDRIGGGPLFIGELAARRGDDQRALENFLKIEAVANPALLPEHQGVSRPRRAVSRSICN